MARDLAVSPSTLKHYLEILQALYIVFTVQPWHRNVARARFENAVATMLLIHVHFVQDARGKAVDLHYIRTKDGAEVDFALSQEQQLTHRIECQRSDATLHRSLSGFAGKFPEAEAVQLVRDLRQQEYRAKLQIVEAATWLATRVRFKVLWVEIPRMRIAGDWSVKIPSPLVGEG